MEALDRARALLERNRVAERVAEVTAAEARLRDAREALSDAERASPTWIHANPAWREPTPLEQTRQQEVRDAAVARREARAARDAAIDECSAHAPPIGLVHGVVQAIEGIFDDRNAGRSPHHSSPHAERLDALADATLARWAVGVDLAALVEQLHYAKIGDATEVGPLAAHAVLAWAPVTEGELLVMWVASQLAASDASGGARG